MFHSLEAYIGRQSTDILYVILIRYRDNEDAILFSLLEICRRGDTVPIVIRKKAWEVWCELQESNGDYIRFYPELESLRNGI